MKNYSKLTRLLLLVFFITGISSNVLATKPMSAMTGTFKPLSYPAKGGPIQLQLSFEWRNKNIKHSCDKATINIIEVDNLIYTGETHWDVTIQNEGQNTYILDVVVPPNDTSGIILRVECGRSFLMEAASYFVTTGDSIEIWEGNPRGHHPKPKPKKPDTTKYEIKIDLRDSTLFIYFKEAVVGLFGPLSPTEEAGFYHISVTKEMLRELHLHGFKYKLMENVPGFQLAPPQQDNIKQKSKTDSLKKQGALDNSRSIIVKSETVSVH